MSSRKLSDETCTALMRLFHRLNRQAGASDVVDMSFHLPGEPSTQELCAHLHDLLGEMLGLNPVAGLAGPQLLGPNRDLAMPVWQRPAFPGNAIGYQGMTYRQYLIAECAKAVASSVQPGEMPVFPDYFSARAVELADDIMIRLECERTGLNAVQVSDKMEKDLKPRKPTA